MDTGCTFAVTFSLNDYPNGLQQGDFGTIRRTWFDLLHTSRDHLLQGHDENIDDPFPPFDEESWLCNIDVKLANECMIVVRGLYNERQLLQTTSSMEP
jgi:hypothetical protein